VNAPPVPRPLKILLAVPHFLPHRTGGAEHIACETARWLIRRGHSVRLVCIDRVERDDGPDRVESVVDAYEGIPVLRLALRSRTLAEQPGLRADVPELTRFFERVLREDRPDLVHLLSGYLLGAPLLAAAGKTAIPVVVTLLDFWFVCPTLHLVRGDGTLCFGPEPIECARCIFDAQRRYRVPDRLVPSLVRGFLRAAREIPAMGRTLGLFETLESLEARRKHLASLLETARAIVSRTSFVADRHRDNGIRSAITVISPVSSTGSVNERSGMPARVRFGFLGQLSPAKGVHLLLRAFAGVRAPAGGVTLSVHGAPNASARYLRRIERMAGRDGRVRLSGRYDRSQLESLLREIDVLVVPSTWHENAPLVVVEAFSAGRPVIGSDVGGIAELVQHEKNGLLFRREDAGDLRHQMQRIVDDPALLQKLRGGIPRVLAFGDEMTRLMELYTSPA
jgi:glycosyltransferase involved in cell wall biosynthesis